MTFPRGQRLRHSKQTALRPPTPWPRVRTALKPRRAAGARVVLLGDLDRSGRALLSFMCERDAERRGKLNLLAAALAGLARGGESALIRQVDGLDPEQTPRYGPLRRAVCGVSRQRFLCRSGSDWQNRGSVRGAVAGLG